MCVHALAWAICAYFHPYLEEAGLEGAGRAKGREVAAAAAAAAVVVCHEGWEADHSGHSCPACLCHQTGVEVGAEGKEGGAAGCRLYAAAAKEEGAWA